MTIPVNPLLLTHAPIAKAVKPSLCLSVADSLLLGRQRGEQSVVDVLLEQMRCDLEGDGECEAGQLWLQEALTLPAVRVRR